MPAVTSISIVIPNYNGESLFPVTLPTVLAAAEQSGLPYEIIVVDDCSTDRSVLFLQQQYPQIRLLQNEKNRGFSPTVNAGLVAAQHSHILILNSDVKLSPGYFNGLFRYFTKEDTFGVMSRITGWEDDKIQDGAKYPSYHGVKIKTSGNYIPAEPATNQWLYSMYLSGANAFVDREKILLLKGLNELFAPFYIEDYELSIRAWRMGWKCYYDHETVCHHQESVTIKSMSRKKQINEIYYRNKMYLHALHLPVGWLFVWHLQLLAELIGNAVMLRGYYVRAAGQYIRQSSDVRACRRAFTALAKNNGIKLLSLPGVAKRVLAAIEPLKIIILK